MKNKKNEAHSLDIPKNLSNAELVKFLTALINTIDENHNGYKVEMFGTADFSPTGYQVFYMNSDRQEVAASEVFLELHEAEKELKRNKAFSTATEYYIWDYERDQKTNDN